MGPLFGIGLQGKSPVVTAEYRLNLYYEFQPEADRTRVAVYGTPGLELFVDFGANAIRGMHQKGDYLYVVNRGTFWRVDNAGTKVSKGTLNTSTGIVDIADNGTQIMITDDVNGYIYDIARDSFFVIEEISTGTTTATTANKLVDSGAAFDTDGTVIGMTAYNTTDGTTATITAIDSATTLSVSPDIFTSGEGYAIGPDGFVTPSSVTYMDTYFIVSETDSNTFQISDNSNGASWDALDFSNAESHPDDIVRLIENNDELVIFGSESTEFWVNTGAVDFPFARIALNEWGLAAKWSLARFDNTLIYLARNLMGEVILVRLNGYTPQRISGFEWEYLVNNYANPESATAFAYMLGGHPMYQINFDEASWLYDGSTGVMSEVKSTGHTRHLAETYEYYIGQNMVGDYVDGKVYILDDSVYSDNGEIITRMLRGKHVFDKRGDDVIIDRLEFFMETGVGLATGQGSNPQAMLRVSKNGGRTWGNQMFQSIGAIGEYVRVLWRRLGCGRDWVMELTITDPVKVVITDTNIDYRVTTS